VAQHQVLVALALHLPLRDQQLLMLVVVAVAMIVMPRRVGLEQAVAVRDQIIML
jgi:hypothetical protein